MSLEPSPSPAPRRSRPRRLRPALPTVALALLGCVALASPAAARPAFYGFAPASGPLEGGTVVTLSGHEFDGATGVYFNGVPTAAFTVLSSTRVTAVAPPHREEEDVQITIRVGNQELLIPQLVTEPSGYDYLPAAEPGLVVAPLSADCSNGGAITGTIRVSTAPTRVEPGAQLRITGRTVFTLDEAFTASALSPFGITSSRIVGGMVGFDLAGTDVSKVDIAGNSSSRYSYDGRPGFPLGMSSYTATVSAGVVDPSADAVVLTPLPFTFTNYRTGYDESGTKYPSPTLITCVPRPGSGLTIPVDHPAQPTPTPPPTSEAFTLSTTGSATIRNLLSGAAPLSGSLAMTRTLPSGALTGSLVLRDATVKLVVLGSLPAVATLRFTSTQPTVGTLTGGIWSTNSKVRIKLPSVKTLGVELAVGANCQVKQVTNIGLSSANDFDATAGGVLTGTFSISDLSGCDFLTGTVDPLIAGPSNAIALSLTPAS